MPLKLFLPPNQRFFPHPRSILMPYPFINFVLKLSRRPYHRLFQASSLVVSGVLAGCFRRPRLKPPLNRVPLKFFLQPRQRFFPHTGSILMPYPFINLVLNCPGIPTTSCFRRPRWLFQASSPETSFKQSPPKVFPLTTPTFLPTYR